MLGANGTGKTTLLKVLLGLTPADGGAAMVGGEYSARLSPATRERVGYVPQVPNQFSWLTGRSMLRYVAAFYPRFDWDYTNELVERWKVSIKTPIGLLSPGQQQRLSIARALGHRPQYLVLDEPISALDPATRIAVIDELENEHRTRGISIIFSSHITGDLERLCSRFVVLSAGAIALDESIDRCRDYRRWVIAGDEQSLSMMDYSGCRRVRKTRDGERVAVMTRKDTDAFRGSMPSGVTLTTEDDSLEVILSEWMQ